MKARWGTGINFARWGKPGFSTLLLKSSFYFYLIVQRVPTSFVSTFFEGD